MIQLLAHTHQRVCLDFALILPGRRMCTAEGLLLRFDAEWFKKGLSMVTGCFKSCVYDFYRFRNDQAPSSWVPGRPERPHTPPEVPAFFSAQVQRGAPWGWAGRGFQWAIGYYVRILVQNPMKSMVFELKSSLNKCLRKRFEGCSWSLKASGTALERSRSLVCNEYGVPGSGTKINRSTRPI